MCRFAPASGDAGKPTVGMVTALYRGKAHGTLPSRLEALGISAEFMPAVLLSKMIEGGLRYGLASTLAVGREALEKAGGLLSIVDHLADDYELGARIAHAGYRVEVSAEVVETSVPAHGWRGFFHHQLRWLRTVRCSRPAGYTGLIFTHGLGGALVNVLASGLSPVSLWLLGLSFFLRLAQAMTVGAAVLGERNAREPLAAAAARSHRDGLVGGGFCRGHDRVARGAIRAQRWKARQSLNRARRRGADVTDGIKAMLRASGSRSSVRRRPAISCRASRAWR